MKLTKGQKAVYATLKEYGPLADHALVPIMQHQALAFYSSSGIRSRRAELAAKGALVPKGAVKMPSGRKAIIWKVNKKAKVKV